MIIGFMGDTHGNTAAAQFMLYALHRQGVGLVIQVGDFGIYTDNSGMKFASKVNQTLAAYGMTLIVVPGNHENWRVINEMVGQDREHLAMYRSNIHVAPRGFRDTYDGVSFVMLGGAPSVDRMWRREWDSQSKSKNPANKHWYAEEQITAADVDYVVQEGYADVMVCHDAPHGVQGIERVIKGNPHGFHIADLLYAEEGRVLLTEAFRGVAPRVFFHGHYHFPVNELIQRPGAEYGEYTQIMGLDCEFHNYSMALLDTETLIAASIDHTDLLDEFRQEMNKKWRNS